MTLIQVVLNQVIDVSDERSSHIKVRDPPIKVRGDPPITVTTFKD